MYEILAALISALVTAAATIYVTRFEMRKYKGEAQKHKGEAATALDNLAGITRPAKVPDGFKRISIMLLGVGGSGKTTFIRSMFEDPKANPQVKTKSYDLYEHYSNPGEMPGSTGSEKSQKGLAMFIGDYKGQDIGTLIRSFVLQQKESYHPMAYGYINALILIADIVPPPATPDAPPPKKRKLANKRRISLHNEQWNDTALDAVFGLVTSHSLSHVCLFINKYDLIEDQGTRTEDQIKEYFGQLRERLDLRAKGAGAKFETIIGSAMTGEGLVKLKTNFYAINPPTGQ